ncbi:MAG: PIG-L family deacetylase [Candidatus Omnitrophota bacterium]
MKKYRLATLLFLLVLTIFLFIAYHWQQPTTQTWLKTALSKNPDRILILAPHPDDEVLGCAGIIQRARKMNVPVKIVFLTYGDNNQWSFLVYRKHLVLTSKAAQAMGQIRHEEAIAADKILGVDKAHLIFLGYPDFKTLNIWYSHWKASPPAKSMLTGVKEVPYQNAFHPGAPYKGEEILEDLKTIIREFKPTKIFVSHPSDYNVDHRSLYLFTRVALWDLADEIKTSLHPYLIHYKNWPLPRGFHPKITLSPPQYLKNQIGWKANTLTDDEIAIKHLAIQKHHSQYISSPGYLLTFIRSPELFGDFADILVEPNTQDNSLAPSRQEDFKTLPDDLMAEEAASFIGIEEGSVHLEDNCLIMSIKLSRPLGKASGLSLYAFGYRNDVPFKEMPKIRLRFANIGHKIFDQSRQIKHKGVVIKRKAKTLLVRIPLDLLGKPQKILTSASTYLGAIPLDWVPWRVLNIKSSTNAVSKKEK